MSCFLVQWLMCLLFAVYPTRTSSISVDGDIANSTLTTTLTTTSTFARATTTMATSQVVNGNSTEITTTTVSVTTTTDGIAGQVASAVNSIVLTDICLHAATISAGLVMVVVGKKVPILLAGNLILAIFVGMIMKAGQDADPEASQWVFWPGIVAVASFMCVCILIKFFRDIMVGVITGFLSATLGLTVTVAATLPVWSLKSFPKEVPWGLSVAILLYIIGQEVARKSVESPLLYQSLSALIGGFLIAHGLLFFLHGRDFAEEVANAMVRAATNSEQERNAIASEVRPHLAGWLGIALGLVILRLVALRMWNKRKHWNRNGQVDVSGKDDCAADEEKGEAQAVSTDYHINDQTSKDTLVAL